MSESNTNCLAGLACPKCGALEPFSIAGTAVFEMYDDGANEFEGLEWENDAAMRCHWCSYTAKVKDFKVKEKSC